MKKLPKILDAVHIPRQKTSPQYDYGFKLRRLEIANLLALILVMAFALGCPSRKPHYTGKYVFDPVRDILSVEGFVYDSANRTGTVTEIISDADGFYLIVEFTEESAVKNSSETTIEQSASGRLYFREKSIFAKNLVTETPTLHSDK